MINITSDFGLHNSSHFIEAEFFRTLIIQYIFYKLVLREKFKETCKVMILHDLDL